MFRKRFLPHIYLPGACFFITFRLNDSLPQSIFFSIKKEIESERRKVEEKRGPAMNRELAKIKQRYFHQFNKLLDLQYGECYLAKAPIAKILYDRILQFDQKLYDVVCFIIMPNHVHLLLDTLPDMKSDVSKWMKLIKVGSARFLNMELGRKGKLWAIESYDRYIRNERHFHNAFYYILNNPVDAGLGDKYQKCPYLYIKDMYRKEE